MVNSGGGEHSYRLDLDRFAPTGSGVSATNIAGTTDTEPTFGTFTGSFPVDPSEVVANGETFRLLFDPEKIGGGVTGDGTVGWCSVEVTYVPPKPS